MGKASRDKGKRGERELASKLREYGFDARRGVQYHGGSDSPDVIGLDGVHIEVKRVERLSLYDALSQSKGEAGAGEMPVVMHRRNNCEWVVIQPLEDWINLYKNGGLDNG
jgi:Holliday junction resolvase